MWTEVFQAGADPGPVFLAHEYLAWVNNQGAIEALGSLLAHQVLWNGCQHPGNLTRLFGLGRTHLNMSELPLLKMECNP